jgi:putative transposase
MSEPKNFFSAKELAALPGMPGTERAVQMKAEREKWQSRQRAGRGGGKEYSIISLPAATRDHLLDAAIARLPEKLCTLAQPSKALAITTPAQLPDLATLKDWQIKTMDARLVFIRLIEQAKGTHGVTAAIRTLVAKARTGQLPDTIQAIVPIANKRSGSDTKKRTLAERTLYTWWGDYQRAGGKYAVLAPKAIEKSGLPPWAQYFLDEYRKPQKPSPAEALAAMIDILPAGIPAPSIHQVNRFLKKYSRLDIERGRKTGAELRAQRSYIERDVSEFNPGDICLCDGHSFKAKVAHPVHGRPFKPEVCAVVDAASRVVWGWSAGLAESTFTVADAIRDAVTPREGKPACIPAILYTDNGAGNTSEANADQITGLFPRLGITFKTGRPGNPQGRGRVERLQGSLWIAAAKKLPTFTGKGMDALTGRKVYLQMDKDVRDAKKGGAPVKSGLLISWAEFLEFADAEVFDYNRRPHAALPKIRDPQTGYRRHMSPLEYLANCAEKGWRPVLPETGELDHLFRPQVQVTARRGRVVVYGNWYQHPDLEHYQGELVNVSYDIHDAATVQVRDWEQRLICVAKFEANKKSFFPVPVVDQAIEGRRKRRTATLTRHLEEVQLEAQTPIEVPAEIVLSPGIEEQSERILQLAERKKGRKLVENVYERYEDICEREKSGDVTGYERQWKADYDAFCATGKKRGLVASDEFCTGSFAEGIKGNDGKL